MATGENDTFNCAANFLRGRKCIFCSSFKVMRTVRGYVKSRNCVKSKSFSRPRREIAIIQRFYQLQPAYRLASELGWNIKVVKRVYQRHCDALFHLCKLEGDKIKRKIELDEAYFGGRRKVKRGRGAAVKSVVCGLLEREGRVYTMVVKSVSAEMLMSRIKSRTRKGLVNYTYPF